MRPHAHVRRAFFALTATTALVVAVGVPAAQATSTAPMVVATAATPTPEQQAVAVINTHRARAGLPALTYYGSLSTPAEEWGAHLARTGTFTHSTSAWRYSKTTAGGWQSSGENLAAGYVTAKSAVNAWMASPGHKANILNGTYTGIGLGYVSGGPYGHYWVAIFGIAKPAIPKGVTPKLSGSAEVGGVVNSRTAGWPAGTTFKYQWYVDNTTIAGAKSGSVGVGGEQVGGRLRVKLMAYNPNYFPTALWSKYSSVVTPTS